MAHKVFVGLSGGVDSAVSAALLKKQGHQVNGVFIKIWQPEFWECTWAADRLDAMRVCAALGIPFLELDLSELYKKEVIDEMLASYKRGETPNPDVLCNKSIKFGAFAAWAHERGADAVATGHYARIIDGKLLRGLDVAKDQSYFLHRMEKRDLARTLFPIGAMTKAQVRTTAKEFSLPVAQKPDSQGLCFVGDVSMRDFLRRYIKVEEGDVLDASGNKIGVHEGAMLYTIGQRHGFVLDGVHEPHYVVSVDVEHNTVTVSPKREDSAVLAAHVDDVHWIQGSPSYPVEVEVQTRYRATPIGARLHRDRGALIAEFAQPHSISPGQSIVFYRGEECLGGGIARTAGDAAFVHNSAKLVAQPIQ